MRKQKLTDSEIAPILAAYRSGDRLGSIARRFNLSATWICRIAVRNGLRRRPPYSPRLTYPESQKIIAMYQRGEKLSVIAATMHRGESTLNKHIRAAKLPYRATSQARHRQRVNPSRHLPPSPQS